MIVVTYEVSSSQWKPFKEICKVLSKTCKLPDYTDAVLKNPVYFTLPGRPPLI